MKDDLGDRMKLYEYCSEVRLLPLKHAARLNPNLEVGRSCFKILELPPLATILNG